MLLSVVEDRRGVVALNDLSGVELVLEVELVLDEEVFACILRDVGGVADLYDEVESVSLQVVWVVSEHLLRDSVWVSSGVAWHNVNLEFCLCFASLDNDWDAARVVY